MPEVSSLAYPENLRGKLLFSKMDKKNFKLLDWRAHADVKKSQLIVKEYFF